MTGDPVQLREVGKTIVDVFTKRALALVGLHKSDIRYPTARSPVFLPRIPADGTHWYLLAAHQLSATQKTFGLRRESHLPRGYHLNQCI